MPVNPILEVSSTTNMGKCPEIVGVSTTLPLPYLIIPMNIIQLEKFDVSALQILKIVC